MRDFEGLSALPRGGAGILPLEVGFDAIVERLGGFGAPLFAAPQAGLIPTSPLVVEPLLFLVELVALLLLEDTGIRGFDTELLSFD